MGKTKIEWTEYSWTPIRARNLTTGKIGWHCEHATTGCEFCYAEGMNKRLGTGLLFKPGHRKDIEIFLDEKMLLAPLRWKRPRMVFVCSMTDLFAGFVQEEWIDRIFAAMALCPQHIFQVLTKRAERMRHYCSHERTPFRIAREMDATISATDLGPEEIRPIVGYPGYFASSHGFIYSEKRGRRRKLKPDAGDQGYLRVPLYASGDKSSDRLLVHRIILETFLGPPPEPDVQGRHRDGNPSHNAITNLRWGDQEANWSDSKRHGSHRRYAKLTAVQADEIRRRHAAGETGEELAREFDVSATQIRNIAAARQWAVAAPIEWPLTNMWAGVSAERQQEADERIPFLLQTPAAVRFISAEPLIGQIDLTQCGAITRQTPGMEPAGCIDWVIGGGESGPSARPMNPQWARDLRDQCAVAGIPYFHKQNGAWASVSEVEGAGEHYHFPDGRTVRRVGKKAAGRLLDGVEHNEFPEPR